MMYRINLIGAGRLGLHWLAAFSSQANLQIQQVFSRHLNQSDTSWSIVNTLEELKSADITLICVADDELQSIIEQLAKHVKRNTKQTFVHCAGRYNSDLLTPLADLGAQVATVHPLRAFTRQIEATAFDNCPVSIEGDQLAIHQIEPILKQLGAQPFIIDKTQKTLYHSACTIASNGLVGLAYAANKLFSDCGIDPNLAKQLTLSLMTKSLKNCQTSETLLDALTGPIARQDKQTVNAHLDTLSPCPDIQNLYYYLSQQILSLTNNDKSLHDWLQS